MVSAGSGDTQPVSQSIFDSLIKQHESVLENGLPADTETDEPTTLRTLHEGDTGHINLVADFSDDKSDPNYIPGDAEDANSKVDESSPSNFQVTKFPESQRFIAKTPATAKKSQDVYNDPLITPSMPKCPIAPNLGSSGGLMALSQVFKATQAPSSPLPDGPQSDILTDRPSPNIPIQHHPLGSRLRSSPTRTPRSNLRRGLTEPLDYITMEESQCKRERALQERRVRSAQDPSSDQFDEEFNKPSSLIERRNRQRKIDEETHQALASISARASPNPSKNGRRRPPFLSSSKGDHSGKEGFNGTSTPPVSEETEGSTVPINDNCSEEETEREEETLVVTSQPQRTFPPSEEDKENHDSFTNPKMSTMIIAHERLSQVLEHPVDDALPQTPPAHNRRAGLDHSSNAKSDHDVIVRDSQPSPNSRNIDERRRLQSSQRRALGSQGSDVEKIPSSPLSNGRTQSSQAKQPAFHEEEKTSTQRIPFSGEISSADNAPALPLSVQRASDEAARQSSIPSRIANTPISKQQDVAVPETSIPGSSPTRLESEVSAAIAGSRPQAVQEEVDLPTPRHKKVWAQEDFLSSETRMTPTRSMGSRTTRRQKMFSSPSGKSIKTMSDILLEKSPQVNTSNWDETFDILSKEDHEFRRMIGQGSPSPLKRIRMNNNRGSSPPQTSRLRNSEVPPPVPTEQPDGNNQSSTSTHQDDAEFQPKVVRRHRAKSVRRGESLWQVEGSPQVSRSAARKPTAQTEKHRPEADPDEITTHGKDVPLQLVAHDSQPSVTPSEGVQGDTAQQEVRAEIVAHRHDSRVAEETEANNQALAEVPTEVSQETVRAPNRILAHWIGKDRGYYPGLFVGCVTANGELRYNIEFVDGDRPVAVAPGFVKRLELRIGDLVKLRVNNRRKGPFVVRGFANRVDADVLSNPDGAGGNVVTDVYGYATVILAEDPRKNLSRDDQSQPSQAFEAPLENIYFDTSLWKRLNDRSFTPDVEHDLAANRTRTPQRHILTTGTPDSRRSRSFYLKHTGLFAAMVFAVSFVNQDDVKYRITKLISENGGTILADGFEELFEFPSNVPSVSLGKPGERLSQQSAPEPVHFRIAGDAQYLGFACLIADKHSRRVKYMQALALNVPCLSGRWVEDCVRQNRIVDWQSYLLPAGESKYLYGAIRSRTLPPIEADKARFVDMVSQRSKLLDGQSVLVVMGRDNVEERRKAYNFLTYALGATRVERVLDIKSAKAALEEVGPDGEPVWDWVYVNEHEEGAVQAMLAGRATEKTTGRQASYGRKRKRAVSEAPDTAFSAGGGKKVKIVTNEIICQSLILGRMYEEA